MYECCVAKRDCSSVRTVPPPQPKTKSVLKLDKVEEKTQPNTLKQVEVS